MLWKEERTLYTLRCFSYKESLIMPTNLLLSMASTADKSGSVQTLYKCHEMGPRERAGRWHCPKEREKKADPRNGRNLKKKIGSISNWEDGGFGGRLWYIARPTYKVDLLAHSIVLRCGIHLPEPTAISTEVTSFTSSTDFSHDDHKEVGEWVGGGSMTI